MFRRTPQLVVFLMLYTVCRAAEPKARTFVGHTMPVNAVAVSSDGKLIASTGADGIVKVWDAVKGKELFQLPVQSSGWSVAFSPDGARLVIAAQDFSVRVFDAATGRQLRSCEGHTQVVWAATFSPDGKTLASASAGRDGAHLGRGQGEGASPVDRSIRPVAARVFAGWKNPGRRLQRRRRAHLGRAHLASADAMGWCGG